jgi:hypothetical protein
MTHIIIERVVLEKILEVLEENHHLIEEHERSEYLALYDRQITAIKQALLSPTPPQRTEQEPVAWMDVDGNVSDNNDHKCFPIPLYTHSPQRTEQNFCSRCGKRTNDIHTCTPPKD